ncbi:hypothetical protein D9615_003808 [Tricholomella constricta]|uniref:Uncharacterized protein n=1 Tax=Tricholomella constricta TaxID=117010 RepID=A0A8H5HHU6_9AGAR|nr:hypothetical protein D9615_003808 [Tricholomella constricta]
MAWMLNADSPIASNRIPALKYEQQNGFAYSNYAGPITHEPKENLSEPKRVALDAQRNAQYILTQKDRPMPTLEQMQEELKSDTSATIKQRIADLQKQHLSDLQRLYTCHAEEFLDDALDLYLAKDDLQYLADGENNLVLKQSYGQLEMIYEESRRNLPQQMQWENDVERMRHSHLVLLNELYVKLKRQEMADEEARQRREADFPMSIEDYKGKSKDVQLRVARFLTANDPGRQERMLSEYRWASRQVKPLQEIFNKNAAFKADIIAQLIEVKDPRKRS